MSHFLVTGAAGFIGSHLTDHLLSNGHKVTALDNFSTGKEENLAFTQVHTQKSNFKLIKGDIREIEDCKAACVGVDYVLHQAALGSVPRSIEHPLLYNDNNITGTLNILHEAHKAKVKRVVFASSSSVYGDTKVLPKVETMTPTPKSPYALGKLTGEYYCRLFYECYGLETVALRYFNVFGPKQDPNSQYAAVIPKFITTFLKNESPHIHGDGTQTRDFTYIQNVIQANVNAACFAKKEALGQAHNIGCSDRISILELANLIAKLTNSIAKPIHEPPRAGDVKDSLADITLAKRNLGLSDFISLREGLEKTVGWYKQS